MDTTAANITKVLDMALAPIAPVEVQARLTSPEFAALRADHAAAAAALDALTDDSPAPARHAALDAAKAASVRLRDYRLDTARQLAPRPVPETAIVAPAGVHPVGAAESGTAEWLKMRQLTLGGSDVAAICKLGEWGSNDYEEVRGRYLDLDPQDQVHEGFSLIGDLWEDTLVHIAARICGETVYSDKATYGDGERHANLDGFTRNADGTVHAVIEAKTASTADGWEDDTIPVGYHLQTEHYIDTLNGKSGLIIVNVADHRVLAYIVRPGGTVPTGPASNKALGEAVTYTTAKANATRLVKKWNVDRETARAGAKAPTKRRQATLDATALAAWTAARERGVVFVDLETSTFTAKKGHIIEAAFIREDGNTLHRFYGVPDNHLAWNGTGAVDVHHITPDNIAGLPVLLENVALVDEIQHFIGNRVLVAHNVRFEQSWLSEAGIDVTYACTMKAFSALVGEQTIRDNTMRSLVTWAGGVYTDAHRALADTQMMAHAFATLRPFVWAALDAETIAAAS